MNVKISKTEKPVKTLSYEKCQDLIIKELSKIKEKQYLKEWCKKNNINYITLNFFYNRKYKKNAPIFMTAVLQALGYEVSFHKEIIFKIKINK